MTLVWVVLALVAIVAAAAVGYVGWRDRHRLPSVEDGAAGRIAAAEAERQAADRQGQQGTTWDPGKPAQ
ncbi:hypothetical protein [Micromonospora zhanjiangensis]|uniref:Uncharacterized protein n=1 Tax=Micromonospora zhanjiangensis TaxID=1522057 RepID=A0ABV8KWY3_9ACTN